MGKDRRGRKTSQSLVSVGDGHSEHQPARSAAEPPSAAAERFDTDGGQI